MKKIVLATLLALGAASPAHADIITDWNAKTSDLIGEAKMGTPPAVRTMALVQTATHEAVKAASPASLDAAVAAANRAVLLKALPAVQASTEAAYQAALAKLPDGAAKNEGIAIGEKAAANVLASRADDMPAGPETYRPFTTPGTYVPTSSVAVPVWPQRTPEQTDVAKFWDFSLPAIYCGALHAAANQPGRTPAQNARLFAIAAQAMDDALIAVFDAKYHYNYWRPVTAIRNGDLDGNNATDREASWMPLIDTPMHPEFPSGHGVLAGAVGAVLKAEFRNGAMPTLSTTSPTLKGVTRQWTSVDAFVAEIGDARIWGGLHYRFSVDTAAAMGKQIGELAAKRASTRVALRESSGQ